MTAPPLPLLPPRRTGWRRAFQVEYPSGICIVEITDGTDWYVLYCTDSERAQRRTERLLRALREERDGA